MSTSIHESLCTISPRENVTVVIEQPNQASSAQGIELFEDLLWDLAALSFVPHVFQPSLTFFPASAMDGEDPNGTNDPVEERTGAQSEATVCAQLVSVVCPKNLPLSVCTDTHSFTHVFTSYIRIRAVTFQSPGSPVPPRGFQPACPGSLSQYVETPAYDVYLYIHIYVVVISHCALVLMYTHIHMRTRKPCLCPQAQYPRSFALVRDGEDPVILVAETDADYHRSGVVFLVCWMFYCDKSGCFNAYLHMHIGVVVFANICHQDPIKVY